MYRLWLDYDWAIFKPCLLFDFNSVLDTSNKNMLLSLHIPYNQYYINSLETLTIACIVLYCIVKYQTY